MAQSDVFLVCVDGKPGHEEAYAKWFCGAHMADMRKLPGVSRAFGGRLRALDGAPPPAQLCGYYETPDCGELLNTIAANKGTAALPASDLQGVMVWRVLETVGTQGEPPSSEADILICLFPGEPDTASLCADLPVAAARLTRIGALQPARGREYSTVLFLGLPAGTDPAAIATSVATGYGKEGARFLLASAHP